MNNQSKSKRIIKGEDAEYMAKAMDRQGISYHKHGDEIILFMNDSEYEEALEDMQCEIEMSEIGYRLCVVSLRTSCDQSGKCGKIMKSMNKNGYIIMKKDQAAFEEMLKYDI